ncbi:MAG TPA: TolC family protein [Candidatus Ozemobacteraceae bacterium]|nr:TolC family protein [Candidatus Ozemobacteraceae bacterium]
MRRMIPAVLGFLFLAGATFAAGDTDPTQAGQGITLKDAVRITLEKQATIQASRLDVAMARARLQQARGAFDQVLSMSLTENIVRNPFTVLEQTNYQVGKSVVQNYLLQIGLARQNRAGVRIIPSLQVSGTRTSPIAMSRSPELLGEGGLHLTVIAPLARGRRHDMSAAAEASAELETDAALCDARFQAIQAVYRTIGAYWAYLAAERRLEVQILAEQRGRERVENLKKLGVAGQAGLVSTEADLAETQADILTARQAVIDARAALGLAMGITPAETLALGSPMTLSSDEIPEEGRPGLEDALIAAGLAQRQDLAALSTRKSSASALVPALRSQTRPRFDLSLDVGYNGLSEGGSVLRPAETLYRQTAGFNSTVRVAYEFPLENRMALGGLRQQEEMVKRLDLVTADLARSIQLNIQAAYREVALQHQAVQTLVKSTGQYHTALLNEEEKQKNNQTTILDTLTMEDRFIASVLKMQDARENLALALARLQFECGGKAFALGKDGVLSLEHLFEDPMAASLTAPVGN